MPQFSQQSFFSKLNVEEYPAKAFSEKMGRSKRKRRVGFLNSQDNLHIIKWTVTIENYLFLKKIYMSQKLPKFWTFLTSDKGGFVLN